MIYPESIEEKLGFDVIRQRIRDYCVSEPGKRLVSEISFETNKIVINSLLSQADEFVQLVAQGELPAIGSITDIYPHVKKAKIQGNWLSGPELHEILVNVI